MSIRLRLTLWYSSILAVTLLIFGIGLYVFLNQYIDREFKGEIKSRTEDVYSRMRILPGFEPKLSGLERDPNTSYLFQIYSLINDRISSSSGVLTELGWNLPVTDDIKQKAQSLQPFFITGNINGDTLLIYNIPIKAIDRSTNKVQAGWLLQGAVPMSMYVRFFELLRYVLIILGLITIILAATFGWFLSRKALRPIEKVIIATDQIEKGADLQKRIEYDGPQDEIGRLISTINGMLTRIQFGYSELEEAYRAQRRFVADASHELRTPLTTIRGNVDLLEKMWRGATFNAQSADSEQMEMSLEAMQDIAGEAQRMSRLVSDLLALARADAGFVMELTPIPLKPIVEEAARRTQFLPHTAVWQVGDLTAADEAFVRGNHDYLQQMLTIFIENAFKYTPQGTVGIDSLRGNGQVGIRIADTGIGMEKEEVPHIFERFYRADVSRGETTGTGLGLSIAKWIIDEHGGSVEVKTRKGEGTHFVIWLPIVLDNVPE